jgi:protein-S-isoprenylcysteine O-methyltransferase Ste14
MTSGPHGSRPTNAVQDVARLGIIRPPFVYLATLITGTLIQLARPSPFLPGRLSLPLGASLVVVAVALFASAVRKFRAAGTPVPARKPTIAIVRTGPYRFSRNPIYLAFSLLQLGVAIWANSLWLVATLVVAVALINYVVIPKEEQYLERKFGAEYLNYKRSVRRWL